jgi:hypothetical protein
MRRVFPAALVLTVGLSAAASAQSVGGRYEARGTNVDGSPYSGTATITRTSNTTCRIRWQTGSTSDGFCMLAGRSFAAAYQLQGSVGLVVYELQPDGALNGVWTIADRPGAGTEVLTPIR